MEEIGKSALIAIVGLMASAVMVAGGVVLRPGEPPPPPGPEAPQVALALPAPPPASGAPSPPRPPLAEPPPSAEAVPAPPPSLARALPPRRPEDRPLSLYRPGPEASPFGLALPAPTADVPLPPEAERATAPAPAPLARARPQPPSLARAAPPPAPRDRPLSSLPPGPRQAPLALRLATPPAVDAPTLGAVREHPATPPPTAAMRPAPPSLGGAQPPPTPRGRPLPALSSFQPGPPVPGVALDVPPPPKGAPAPLPRLRGEATAVALAAPPPGKPALPSLAGAAPPPSPPGKPETAAALRLAALPERADGESADGAVPRAVDAELPPWKRYAALAPDDAGRPMIVLIVDDLGLNRRRVARTIALPAPLTLAILPYAENIEDWTGEARAAGHELMLHLPMEPNDPAENPGPNALLADLAPKEIARRVDWSLSRFDGYVGVNNHMGSRFTADPALMRPLLTRLRERGLLFVDSLTTSASVGQELASRLGVPSAARDIFLDNVIDVDSIRAQLAKVERCAIRKGYCIAIGHPHPETLTALESWLPGLASRGFVLMPISAIVARRMTG